jgi:hypothetical protein
MKSLRSMLMLLLSITTALMMVQTAAAAPGKGGGGSGASLIIDTIRLDDPLPQGGPMTAHISGGGFLGGTMPVEVTMDGGPALPIVEVEAETLIVTLPATTEGDKLIQVRTGDGNKESDSATIHLGGEMIVSCISWFVSGPEKEHAHTEVHLEDTDGNPVVGATVVWKAENPSGVLYQTNTSPTHDHDGHAKELLTCPAGILDSGTTDWFCCIGAGGFDQDGPPGKRACDPGIYTATILEITSPLFRNMIFDHTNEDNVLVETFFLDIEEPQFP